MIIDKVEHKIVEGYFSIKADGELIFEKKNLVVNNARTLVLQNILGSHNNKIDKFQLTKTSKTSVNIDDINNAGDPLNTLDLVFDSTGDGVYGTPNGEVTISSDLGARTITYNIIINEFQGNNKEYNCASLFVGNTMFNIILFGLDVKTANKIIEVSWTLEF